MNFYYTLKEQVGLVQTSCVDISVQKHLYVLLTGRKGKTMAFLKQLLQAKNSINIT